MTYIGSNIKKIRTVKKLSQLHFAELFGINRASIGAYEEGRAEPKLEKIIKIAEYFGLSIDVLLTRELTVNDLYKLNVFNQKLDKAHELYKKNNIENKEIRLVGKDIQIEYIVNRNNADFLASLPVVKLPYEGDGGQRAFEVSGSTMEYYQNGLHHGDILLCNAKSIDKHVPIDHVYVIILEHEVHIMRLRSIDGGKWVFVCDAPNQDRTLVKPGTILELWEVKGVYTKHLKLPVNLEGKVAQIERKVENLLDMVVALKNH